MQIITTAVIKGGTGKTATVAALAQAAAANKKKVLAIDLDAQGNLTSALGADFNHLGSYHLFTGVPIADTIQHTAQNIDVIAANPDLATITTSAGSAGRLRSYLEAVQANYSLILIDTPPTMGELLFNALQASTGLLIPLETDTNSLRGMFQIVDIANQMKATNPGLAVLGVVLTKYDARPNLNKYLKGVIEEQAATIGTKVIGTIRPGIAVREAMALNQSLFSYAPKSKPAEDYSQLYKKIAGGKLNGK